MDEEMNRRGTTIEMADGLHWVARRRATSGRSLSAV